MDWIKLLENVMPAVYTVLVIGAISGTYNAWLQNKWYHETKHKRK